MTRAHETAHPPPGRALRVAQFPAPAADRPSDFVHLTEQATAASGVQAVHARLRPRWALRQRDADVIHLHWLEFLVNQDPAPILGLARTLVRSARLLACLAACRVRAVGVVWTIHNLAAHEPVRPRLERALARAVYRAADAVIVHSDYARAQVQERFGRTGADIHVIPHPNYAAVFPDSGESRAATRARLGLPADAYVYLCFGQIRPYKRLDEVIERFRQLPAPDARLLILGRVSRHMPAAEVQRLGSLAAEDPRVVLRLEHVADHDVVAVHRASDAAVIAYRDVFSSGALLLALSEGLPVVTPASGTARELFTPPAIEPFEGADLPTALQAVRTQPETRTAAAHAAAAAYPWSEAGRQLAAIYRAAARPRAHVDAPGGRGR